jgi:dCTP deaminase
LKKHEVINIKPGQFAAFITEEILNIPKDYIGFITVRFSYKSKGLVNISGFHMNPRFKSKLVFSVYNAGSTTVSIRRGEAVFSLFLSEMKSPIPESFGYEGDFQNMKGIPLSIIEPLAGAKVPSMNEMEDKVNRNETYIKIYGAILLGLLGTIIALLVDRIF